MEYIVVIKLKLVNLQGNRYNCKQSSRVRQYRPRKTNIAYLFSCVDVSLEFLDMCVLFGKAK